MRKKRESKNTFPVPAITIFWSLSLSIIYHLSPLILANTLVAFVLLRNSRFNFHCYTQREPTPTQKSVRKRQLRPFATSCEECVEGILTGTCVFIYIKLWGCSSTYFRPSRSIHLDCSKMLSLIFISSSKVGGGGGMDRFSSYLEQEIVCVCVCMYVHASVST